ncbi:MAG: RluA family pseudouridine synthase [Chloroflexota bacterium]|nr:MAG: RluA family pseudouridine synthase [Chloroflexota bacterium]
MRILKLRVEESGERLDKYLAEHGEELTRSRIQQLIEQGLVTLDGKLVKAGVRLKAGQEIVVQVPVPVPSELGPAVIPLHILYEDEDLIVLDKPAGLVTHPGPGHRQDTLVNALLGRGTGLSTIGGVERPGIVHRLDKHTSGVMVVAKNDRTFQSLAAQFKGREVHKEYIALVRGHLRPAEGIVDAPIGRDPRYRQRMAVVDGGRPARTRYRVLRYLNSYTLLVAMPETGRTHQIRVHLAALGHPVVGDEVYGRDHALGGRHFLHAAAVTFRLPSTGEQVEFRAELPAELQAFLEKCSSS